MRGKTICRGAALIIAFHILRISVEVSWGRARWQSYVAFFIIRAWNEYQLPIIQAKCCSRLHGVANVAAGLPETQSILTHYIQYTTNMRQTNRTGEIHLPLWIVDTMWKITLQHYLSHWGSLLFIQSTRFDTGTSSSYRTGKWKLVQGIQQDGGIFYHLMYTRQTNGQKPVFNVSS